MGDKSPDTESFDQLNAAGAQAATIQANIAKQLFEQSNPLRTQLLAGYKQAVPFATQPVTVGNVVNSPLYGALKSGAARQYQVARNDVFEDAPGTRYSGALADNLADVSNRHADTVTQGMGAIAEAENARRLQVLNMATNFGIGQPSTAMSGLSGASSAFAGLSGAQANMAYAQAQQSTEKGTGFGQLLGKGSSK